MDEFQPRQMSFFNVIGVQTLIKKEVGRFINVYMQTIIAPVITSLLFFSVLSLAFGGVAREVKGVDYLSFLAPGLIMMAMVQSSFSNCSSSLIISKVQGNIVDILMPPLSSLELFLGFVIGGVFRGLVIGLLGMTIMSFFVEFSFENMGYSILFAILGCYMLSVIGLLAGIWADKFDHIAAVTNFIIVPMTFLSGTFYSIYSLSDKWQDIALLNPFFYMIDGFRSGFIGYSEGSVGFAIIYLFIINAVLTIVALLILRNGYKLKS